ncbi:carbohydrate ABC transporter permease [Microlunatus parietis]|uniref:Multiple sugar transport system permease protein n=1 Tax=Microlunatus parietis TaxID=682979 RepID=A0A7Y9LAM2_9ACTN|nr:sugar ABC transporter permease [Microlunatus parietis]NYE72989.1 multiple sugar transport system permease protein [Microlunatus parietis]
MIDIQTPVVTASPSRPGRAVQRRRRNIAGWLFIGPAMLLFAIFVLGPFIAALTLSLFSYDLLTPAEFTGLDNFARLFSDELLARSLRNTFLFALGSMITHLPVGLLLAVAVNAGISKILSYFVRVATFFPFLISWAAVALLWRYVLDPTFGYVSYYLGQIGITPPIWLTDPAWALPSIIGIDFWHTIGYTFLIMLAGLQTVPKELHEAARVDGAGAVSRFFHITVPLMTPSLFFATVVTFIGAFQIFDPIQIITKGGPDNATISAVMYLYQIGFESFQIGYASTVSLVIFVVIMLVTVVQFVGSRKWVHNA